MRIRGWEPPHEALFIALTALFGLALIVLRRPSVLSDPGLYGEDGAVFLPESLQLGLEALSRPYNGYLHLVPRLIAATVAALPLAWTPVAYALGSGVVSVACSAIVLSRRFTLLAGRTVERLVLFALLLLIPRLLEVHLSLNSVLWFCGIGLLLIGLADDPTTRVGRIVEVLAVPVLVLSGLAGVVLVPLSALRWLRTRSTQSIIVGVAWVAAATVQVVVYLVEERDNGEFAGLARLSRVGLEKVFGSLVLGGSLVDGRWFTGAPVAALVLLALIAAAWTAIVVSGMRWEHWVGVGYALCASLLAGFTALGPIAIAVPGGFTLLPDRYSVLPIAAVLVGLVCAQPSIPSLKYARIALLVVVLVMRVTDFTVPARPTTHWGSAVECLEDPENECLVDLNPDGWTVTIPAGVR